MAALQSLFASEPFLLLGVILIIGHYCGKLAQRAKLPSLIGFMLLGVALGPSGLDWVSEATQTHFSFLADLALGFVAFAIGSELSLKELRNLGGGVISVIFAESFGAFILVTVAVYLLTHSLPLALLFGALAPASAPAGTVAVIQECRARGPLTKALYAVVGFDDGLAILIFGFSAALAKRLLLQDIGVTTGGESLLMAMRGPLLEIVMSLVIGAVLGVLFTLIITLLKSPRDMLIATFGAVFIGIGLSIHWHLSLILTNMVIGFILVNTRRNSLVKQVSAPLEEIMPLIFLLFFSLAGAHLKIADLPKLGFVGIVYIIGRTVGLMGGARLGAAIGKVHPSVKKYVGMGILSQAGVAIGLSLMIIKEFEELAARTDVAAAVTSYAAAHPAAALFLYNPLAISAALITTVTATCIVFEIAGPILTKIALTKAGETAATRE
ncbi:MAG: cation:proton antiporter [Lentisphaeria bacterium]|nr:cation:proton antiporter [Lentisphaeria bacterium]